MDLPEDRSEKLLHRPVSVASGPVAPGRRRASPAASGVRRRARPGAARPGAGRSRSRRAARACPASPVELGEPAEQQQLVDRRRPPAALEVELGESDVEVDVGGGDGEGQVAGVDRGERAAGPAMRGGRGEEPSRAVAASPAASRPRPASEARSQARLGLGLGGGSASGAVSVPRGSRRAPARRRRLGLGLGLAVGAAGSSARLTSGSLGGSRRASTAASAATRLEDADAPARAPRPAAPPSRRIARSSRRRARSTCRRRRSRDSASSSARRAASLASGRRPAPSRTSASRSSSVGRLDPPPGGGEELRPAAERLLVPRRDRERPAVAVERLGRSAHLDEDAADRRRAAAPDPGRSRPPRCSPDRRLVPAAQRRRRGRAGGRPCSARRATARLAVGRAACAFFGDQPPMTSTSRAFWTWSRFSDWSQMMLRGPSMTSDVISSPRWAGRQCIATRVGPGRVEQRRVDPVAARTRRGAPRSRPPGPSTSRRPCRRRRRRGRPQRVGG